MAALDADTMPLSPSEHQIQLRRAVIASTIGTAIEWYDFLLYSTVTGPVFAKLFFPHSRKRRPDRLRAVAGLANPVHAKSPPVGPAGSDLISLTRRCRSAIPVHPRVISDRSASHGAKVFR